MERLTRVKEVEEDVFEVIPYFDCEEIRDLDEFDLIEWENELYNKLAEYENTGLQPSDIYDLQDKLEEAQQQFAYECGYNAEFVATQKENEQLKQQLAEKEELLKNAICPKFKVGQEVFFIHSLSVTDWTMDVFPVTVIAIKIYKEKDCEISYVIKDKVELRIEEDRLFATKAEAQKKLGEVKNK